ARISHSDYDREMSLIAEDFENGESRILGVGRLSKLHGKNAARFTLLISDPYQGMGIGTELLKQLVAVARDEKLDQIEAIIAKDNEGMQDMVKRLGFKLVETE